MAKIAVLENYKYSDLKSSWTKQMIWLAEALKSYGFEVVSKNLTCNGLIAGTYSPEKHNPCDICVYNHTDVFEVPGNLVEARQRWIFKPTVPDGIHTTVDILGFGPYSDISFNRPDYESVDMKDVKEFFNTKVRNWIDRGTMKYSATFKKTAVPYEDYWLVLGQVPGDTTNTRYDFGDYNKKMAQVVKELVRIDDRDIVVKLHPYMDGITGRHTVQSDKMEKTLTALSPKVHVYKGKVDIHEFIRNCRAVILGNSGSGIDTMMHHKPIIAWGKPEYHWVAYDLRYLADLSRAIKFDWFDMEAQDKWLYWYIEKYCYYDQNSCTRRVGDLLEGLPEGMPVEAPAKLPDAPPPPAPRARISVVSTAWGGYGKHVPKFLEYMENQTVKPYEVIVVLSEAHGLKMKPPGIKYVKEPVRRPLGTLINKGIEQAMGDWVLVFDVDDELYPNAIEEIEKAAKNADVVALKYDDEKKGVMGLPEIGWNGRVFTKGGSQSGYMAFKRAPVEDTHVWKWALLYKAMAEDKKIVETENVCARYSGRHENVRKMFKRGEPEIFQMVEDYRLKYSNIKAKKKTIRPSRRAGRNGVHVLQTFDNNYAPHSHNSMKSIIETTPGVVIHAIITDDVEERHLFNHPQVAYYRNTPKRRFEGFPAAKGYINGSAAPYNYIEALDILDVPRFIIQGIDMIATTSLKPLYDTRVSNIGVAAIPQTEAFSRANNYPFLHRRVKNYTSGYPAKKRWNRVVTFPLASLVIDTKICRQRLYRKIMELYDSDYAIGDMMLYQIAIEGNYYPLDGRWCVGVNNNPVGRKAGKTMVRSEKDMWILNWYGKRKPWHNGAPFKEYWDKYNEPEPVPTIKAGVENTVVNHF